MITCKCLGGKYEAQLTNSASGVRSHIKPAERHSNVVKHRAGQTHENGIAKNLKEKSVRITNRCPVRSTYAILRNPEDLMFSGSRVEVPLRAGSLRVMNIHKARG